MLAVVCLSVPFYNRDKMNPMIGFIMVICGFILLFFALISTANYLGTNYAAWLKRYNEAASITRASNLASFIVKMNSEQARLFSTSRLNIEIIPSTQISPAYLVRLGSELVPINFIDDFLASGTDEELIATSAYTDSRQGDYAKAVTRWLEQQDLCQPHGPNTPAKWINGGREAAYKAFGFE